MPSFTSEIVGSILSLPTYVKRASQHSAESRGFSPVSFHRGVDREKPFGETCNKQQSVQTKQYYDPNMSKNEMPKMKNAAVFSPTLLFFCFQHLFTTDRREELLKKMMEASFNNVGVTIKYVQVFKRFYPDLSLEYKPL